MAGRFDPSSIMQNLQDFSGLTAPSYEPPHMPVPDNRSRAEVREDFEKKLAQLDFAALKELEEKALDTTDPEEFLR